jgi:lycopene cyclase domain-containing protein
MTTGPTYLQFHAALIAPAVAVTVVFTAVNRTRTGDTAVWRPGAGRTYWSGVALVTAIALAYTVPWDNHLIARGVWSYGTGATLATLGHAPVGEYLFIAVQPGLTALWLSNLSLSTVWPAVERPVRTRAAAVAVAVGVGAGGWQLFGTDATFYLGAILAWAAPVLALQWAVGAPQLLARRRLVALGTLVPAAYLSVADRVAIEYGIWTLSDRYTTGIELAGLPVEEALFFLVTNLFVVQGLVLYRWVLDNRTVTAPRIDDPRAAE